MIGTTFGPYRIDALLGRGGMGEVYRARDTTQGGRTVALKVLPGGLSDDPAFLARFRREAEIAARIAEPHVVPIHRYGEIDGRLFLDMQLVDGTELGALLADGPLDPARAVALVEQVAAALDAAHADGLVHRDVKPANVLVTAEPGRPEFAYLVDFGIATATDPGSRTALTRTGAVVGTLSYMAPERFLARPAGPPADVYALACVLHELLTAEKPYPGTGYAPQVLGHLESPPPRPATRPGVPPAFDAVIARGLAKEPGDRHRSAGELAAHARHALTDRDVPRLPVHVRPAWERVAVPEPPARRGRWRRWPLVAAAAVLVVAAVAMAVVVWRPGAGPGVPSATPAAGPVTERTLVGVESLDLERVGDRPVLVNAGSGAVAVVDLATGERLGRAIPEGLLTDVAAAELDGSTVIVRNEDGFLRVYDAATGVPRPTAIEAGSPVVVGLAVGQLDGRPVVVASGDDRNVRAFDLATGERVGTVIVKPVGVGTGSVDGLDRLAVIDVDGRAVVVGSDAEDGMAWSWDLATGRMLGPPVVDENVLLHDLTTVDGRPAVFVPAPPGPDGARPFTTYDLTTGEVLAQGAVADSAGLTAGTVGGRSVLVSVTDDGVAQVLDLRTAAPLGEFPAMAPGETQDLVTLGADGRTYLLTWGFDYTVGIWDLTGRIPT